jgi:Putative DNA-binding domain
MNNELFERLLYEEESTTLDFKKEQYRFVKATDEEKSELLKDILGFANAWRRSDAYILIGVDDVRGGRSDVVGISAADHLTDHSLQQFVNNLTNQPVRFRYEAFGFEGKQVGLICIEEQTRPIYLKRDYGKLKKQEVYARRGSSTDPNKPASLEEIAQMRVGAGHSVAELVVEFGDMKRDDSLGASIAWDPELCEMPEMESIPDLERPRQRNLGIDLSAVAFDPMNRPNHNFFRQLANYEFTRRLFRPVRLVVRNVGQVAANNVRAELTVATNIGVMVVYDADLPDPPKRRADFMSAVPQRIRPAFRREPGEVTIDKNDERFRIEIDCRDLQPGRRVWSDVFYIGKGQDGDITLRGQVFADNLPQPKDFTLTVSVTLSQPWNDAVSAWQRHARSSKPMGARSTVQSELDRGTKFTIRLPACCDSPPHQ